MKKLLLLAVAFFSLTAHAGFEVKSAGKSLGVFSGMNCAAGLTCTKIKGGIVNVVSSSANSTLVAATATAITSAQCGRTFYNTAAVQMELPEASTVPGCKLTFVTLNAANFDVNPDTADQILVQTNAAGDMIRNATLGNTITLQAVSASQWVVVGILGTWSDAN